MRRKPEVGVEHGLQHLHGVATQRKAVCDKQGHEPNRAGHDVADAVPVDAFKDQAKNHCAPTDEHRRRVKVCHRRPALEPHAENQPGGMYHRRKRDEVVGGLVRPLGKRQPAAAGQQKSDHIKNLTLVKRIEIVESKLCAGLASDPNEVVFFKMLAIGSQLGIEFRGVILRIGRKHRGIGLGRTVELDLPFGFRLGRISDAVKEARAHGLPFSVTACDRGNGSRPKHHAAFVALVNSGIDEHLQQAGELLMLILVVLGTGLVCANSRHAGRENPGHLVQILLEVGRVLGPKALSQALVDHQ